MAELFEARKPKDHAIIAEIDGEVSFGKDTKGKRKVVITPFSPRRRSSLTDQAREYLIAKGKHIQVQPGDRVRAGEPLMDGPANPHDILRVKGEKELAAYLVNEIQQVYRLQGVAINDKHIEVIVRQMLRRVRIKDVGDTNFLIDEQVEKHIFERENQKVIERGGKPAIAEPLLLGITKASLSTESFICASLLPGDHEGAHRGGDLREDRPPARSQGERHHGAPHPGRHGPRAVQAAPGHRRRGRGAWLRAAAARRAGYDGGGERGVTLPSEPRLSSARGPHSQPGSRALTPSPSPTRGEGVKRCFRMIDQITYWNSAPAERWVREQATLDVMLRPFGDAAIAAARVGRDERVLDVGCGYGDTSLALADRVGAGGVVVGLDFSTPLVTRARERGAGRANVSFVEGDASSHPVAGGAFDLIFSRFGVMFFADPTGAFAHLRVSAA